MKKSLSLLVAIAMVFSMFATVAAAATDTQSKFEELKEAGIFEGRQGGDPALDSEMTRAEFATVLFRLAGLKPTPATFDDVPESHWASGYIGAAQKEGLVDGVGNNKYAPSRNVTKQELIKVAVTFLGLEVDPNATVEGKAAAWAQPYIAAALAAGLISPQDDYTVPALRGFLVDVTYELYQQIQGIAKVTKAEAISATKVVVSFSDGGQVEVDLDEPLNLGKNTITVTYQDREYKVDVNFEATAASAKQIGAKKIELTFNKAIDDSKVSFAVKNGLADRVVDKFTVSEDKKKAVLELTTKLQSAESTVTIKGVEADDIVAKFTAEEEKVTQVKFKSDKLALSIGQNNLPNYNEVKVGYQILNQFGEEATNVSTPNFQVAKATATTTAANGVLTIQTQASAPFYLDEPVVITGYLRLSTYAVTFSETLKVGQPATVDSVEIKGIYHAENKELNTASTFDDYVLLIEAKDQYGNKLKAEAFNRGAFVTVTNAGIFNVPGNDPAVDDQGPNKDQVGIKLVDPVITPGFDGTNVVRITTLSGKQYTYEVEVKKAATVQKITLLPPSEVIAANDDTVKIPFVAEDQFGNPIKKYSDLEGKITLSPQPSQNNQAGLTLKQDYATKEAYIELKLPDPDPAQQLAIPYPIMAWVNGTSNSSQLNLSIEKAAYPESIAGLKSDVAATLAKDAKTTIKPDYIIVKDNYGRDKKLADLLADPQKPKQGTHKVIVSVVDGTQDVITLSRAELVNKDDEITVTAKQKGSERIRIQLVDLNAGPNDAIVYTYESFIFSVVDDSGIVEYVVEDIPKMSNKENRQVEVKVFGKRSNGTKVALPVEAYSVTPTGGLAYDTQTGKLDANSIQNGFDNGEKKAKIIVTIKASSDIFEKEVVISNAELVPTTIELKDTDTLKGADGVVKGKRDDLVAGGNVIANVFEALKIKDQFGFEMDATKNDEGNAKIEAFNATVGKFDDVGTKNLSVDNNGAQADQVIVNNLETGDSFTVVFTSKASGVSIQVRVVAE